MGQHFQIAIDGPASAGKSTVAKIVAKKLGYVYCDTGAMYRAITLKCLKDNINIDNNNELNQLLIETNITFKPDDHEQRVFINEKDVTRDIRQTDVVKKVSDISAIGIVREKLTNDQRKLADENDIVMDGRDIGSTVLPKAQVKIFLVASVEERAKRRLKENESKGIKTNFEQLKKDIELRDYKDSHREISPLIKAEDAIEIDTSDLSLQEVVTQILEVIKHVQANKML